MQALELQKWSIVQQNYDAQIQALQEELTNAQVANAELDEQKQENLMLKETIDRMRFDMDEMRTNLVSANHGGASARGSLSKSLGAEMQNMMGGMGSGWGMDQEDVDDDERVKEILEVDDDTEGEDVIQTIITRTKRVCCVFLLLSFRVLILGSDSYYRKSRVGQRRWKLLILKNSRSFRMPSFKPTTALGSPQPLSRLIPRPRSS